jgi:PIN domain nuclease of toxin-antitoxin system
VIVWDTHTWFWWVSDPAVLSSRARQIVDEGRQAGKLCISSMSAWEVAMLSSKGRLSLSMPVTGWIRRSEALPFLTFVPVSNAIGVRAMNLPGELHPDPADRIIIATALGLRARLVTRDEKILRYPHVDSVW